MLYNNLSSYLKKIYGKPLKKICIDGGFSCPNRDGKCSTGGCIFCGERGSGEHIDHTKSIREQTLDGLSRARASDEFIVYFQNFTNTYADIKTLKERYDAALFSERIKVLAVGTRPDCIDEDVAKLLASYKENYDVWVELGLQTASDKTAKIINRGYTHEVFENSMKILQKYGIKVVVHLIVGLPGESFEDNLKSAEYVGGFKPFGVKIHSLYVMKGTRLEEMYKEKLYTPIPLSLYTRTVAAMVNALPKETVIHRLTGDCPKNLLVAPEWNSDKNKTLALIREELEKLKRAEI